MFYCEVIKLLITMAASYFFLFIFFQMLPNLTHNNRLLSRTFLSLSILLLFG